MEAARKYLNWKYFIVVCLVFIPILLILKEILLHGVNAPYMDEWRIVNMYRDIKQGKFTISQLLNFQDNEHRIIVPAILHMFFWFISGTNDKFVLILTFVFVILALAIFIQYIWEKNMDLWLLLPIVALLFSYKMNFAWIWPSYNMWIFLWVFLLSSIWCFRKFEDSNNKADLIKSIIFAEVGVYCAASGLFIWIVYLFYFFLQFIIEKKKLFQVHKIVMCISAVVSICLYFYKWERGETVAFKACNLFNFFKAFFILLVNPFMNDGEAVKAVLFGMFTFIISLGVFIYLCIQKKISKYVFTELICFYCMLSMASIAYGRAGLIPGGDKWSTQHAMLSSQYSPMPTVFWIAFIVLVYELIDDRVNIRMAKNKKVLYFTMIHLYILFMITSVSAYPSMRVMRDTMRANAFYLQNYDYLTHDMKMAVYPDEGYIKESMEWIRENGLFCVGQDYKYTYPYGELAFLTPTEEFELSGEETGTVTWYIDSINNANFTGEDLRIGKEEGITVAGWAIDAGKEEAFSTAYLMVGDICYELCHVERHDIAEAYGSEKLSNSGYFGTVVTNSYSPGTYEMKLFIVMPGKEYCEVPIGNVEIYDGV